MDRARHAVLAADRERRRTLARELRDDDEPVALGDLAARRERADDGRRGPGRHLGVRDRAAPGGEPNGLWYLAPEWLASLLRLAYAARRQVHIHTNGDLATEVALDMDHMGFGRGLKGVVMGDATPQTFIPFLATLFRRGQLPFDRFVRFYPFAEIETAIHDSAVTGEVIKPILRMP